MEGYRCDQCNIDFARHDDMIRHQWGPSGHPVSPNPDIVATVKRLLEEDRDLMEKLGDA